MMQWTAAFLVKTMTVIIFNIAILNFWLLE